MLLLLNEWLFHDLLLENGEAKFQETKNFLRKLRDSEDSLVQPAERRWLEKAFALMSREDVLCRSASLLFHSILRDSDRTIRVNLEAMGSVPNASYAGVPSEDIYLVQAYICAGADLLVTTDEGLFQSLVNNPDVNCQMREELLSTYIPEVANNRFVEP